MDALTAITRRLSELEGHPIESHPCLRAHCRETTEFVDSLCLRCNTNGWVPDTARAERIGARLKFPPGSWPSLDRFGEPLEVLESLSDPALRNLARIKKITTPMAPERREALEQSYVRDSQYRVVQQREREIASLQKRQSAMAQRLADLGAL